MLRLVHSVNIESEAFKATMESEYPELFKGIGCMDGEISIKLKEGAIPHVEPIRRVPMPCRNHLRCNWTNCVKKEYYTKWILVNQLNG